MNFYAPDKSYTLEEMYDYLAPFFTNNYVDHIIMQNMKKEGDRYVLAHVDSELAEASFFDPNLGEDITFEQNNDRVILSSVFKNDGLYAPHKEMIFLVYTEDGWKIDDVKWDNIMQIQ